MLHLVWGHGKERKKICHKDETGFHREPDYRTALIIRGAFQNYSVLKIPVTVTLMMLQGCLVILKAHLPQLSRMPGPRHALVYKEGFTSWVGGASEPSLTFTTCYGKPFYREQQALGGRGE